MNIIAVLGEMQIDVGTPRFQWAPSGQGKPRYPGPLRVAEDTPGVAANLGLATSGSAKHEGERTFNISFPVQSNRWSPLISALDTEPRASNSL